MKKTLLIASFVGALFIAQSSAQTLVGTDPTYRNVVLEDFTGIHCGFCPDGHDKAKDLIDAYPGQVIVIAVHAGGYAAVDTSKGHPDYRTPFGSDLDNLADPAGYPAGTVNRRVFPGKEQKPGKTAMGRGNWISAANEVLAEMSPANVGARAFINKSTRELTVEVEVYNTEEAASTSRINVAVLQDKMYGYQVDYGPHGTWYDDYEQNNVLRHLITGQWGEAMTNTAKGSVESKTYTYTIPEEYFGLIKDYKGLEAVLEDMNVAVFMTDDMTGAIVTGTEVGMNPVGIAESDNFNKVAVYPNPATNAATLKIGLNKTANVNVEVFNILGEKVDTPFDGVVNGGLFSRINLNTSNYASGIYIINVKSGDAVKTIKLNVAK